MHNPVIAFSSHWQVLMYTVVCLVVRLYMRHNGVKCDLLSLTPVMCLLLLHARRHRGLLMA